jgi:hypothetical protein
MHRELVEVIHHPERVESVLFRTLDVGFDICPDITRAIGINERSVAKTKFHKFWECKHCEQISRILHGTAHIYFQKFYLTNP